MRKNITITGWRDLFISGDRYFSPQERRGQGISLMVGSAFVFLFAAYLFHLDQLFDGPTTKVIGSVVALYPSSTPEFSLRRPNPRVVYSYQVGTAELHAVAQVSEEVFDGLHVGGSLPVKYLLGNPTTNRIDLPAINTERHKTAYVLAAISILFTCVGAYIFRKACKDIKLGKPHRTPRHLDFIPDPHNRKEVRVRGWSSEDFSKILIDFRKLHDDSLEDEIAAKIHSLKDGTLRVTFPQDVPDRLFPFLINYAQYPEGFGPKADSILVVGKAIISKTIDGIPDPKLVGQEAFFYVPSDDRKYDVVYVQVREETFANSFASSRWKKVADPRLPAGFADLSFAHRITT